MRMKRSVAMLLCALMAGMLCVTALPNSALAAADYTMDFSQGGVISWNGHLVDYSTTDDSGTGWSWTHANKTLTLNGLQFTTTDPVALKLPAGATIALAAGSSNSVTSTFQGDSSSVKDSCGIWCLGMLTVSGDGSLTATGGSSASKLENSIGVEAKNGITLSGSCTLTGIGQDAKVSYGVALTLRGGSITVKDSASLTGRGGVGSIDEYGVVAMGGSITVQDNGRIEGSSSSLLNGVGISCTATNVKGGTLIASAVTQLAMAEAPDLAQYANYRWRTTKTGAYTDSSVTPFSFNRSLDYIEICPPAPPVPVSGGQAPVPKTGDGAPIGLLIGLLLFSGAGLTASVAGRRKRRGAGR